MQQNSVNHVPTYHFLISQDKKQQTQNLYLIQCILRPKIRRLQHTQMQPKKKKKKTSGIYMKNPNLTENCKRMTNINSAGTEKCRIDTFNSRHNYHGSQQIKVISKERYRFSAKKIKKQRAISSMRARSISGFLCTLVFLVLSHFLAHNRFSINSCIMRI